MVHGIDRIARRLSERAPAPPDAAGFDRQAAVAALLREHRGDIRAESRLGEGSTFSLEFPRVFETDAPKPPATIDGPAA